MKIYAVNIQKRIEDKIFNRLLDLVSIEKRNKINKFRFWQDAHNCLIADLIVRKMAHEKLNISNNDICFSENEFGKPFIINELGFEYNVSHSGEWVLVGFDEKSIGVDVEKIVEVDLSIAEKFFSRNEYNDLLNADDKIDYFITLWALKESFIKYVGKGLSYPLKKFSMIINYERIKVMIDGKVAPNIYFQLYDFDPAYKMSLCSSNPNLPKTVQILELPQLIEGILLK